MESTDAARPGTIVAFKARHEAYRLVADLRRSLRHAQDMEWLGSAEERDEAWDTLRAIAQAVMERPEAARILANDPPLFQTVQEQYHALLAREVVVSRRDLDERIARDLEGADIELEPVEWVSRSEWMPLGGLWESRISIGRSEEGWHYAIEASHQGGDSGPRLWSPPFPSREEAENDAWAAHNEIMRPHELAARRREDAEIARPGRREAQVLSLTRFRADRQARISAYTRDEGMER